MDMETKVKEICDMSKTLISCLKTEIDCGVTNVDTQEAGQVADIIKDLTYAEKNIREAKYYELVSEAMEEKGDQRYGYGTNEYMGYRPRVTGNMHMGYRPMVDQEPYINGYLHDPDFDRSMRNSEYGAPYTEYKAAKRHYTETKSMNDKTQMDMHAKAHLEQTIETIEDIWHDASPELKQKMKTELKTLMDSLM